jgi:mRNA interferase MazF
MVPGDGPAPPRRGDIWQTDFDPVVGHEQGGERPAVVISIDDINRGPSDLVVVLPFSTRDRGHPFHVAVPPAASGLAQPSFALCEMIRVVSRRRLRFVRGRMSDDAMAVLEDRLRIMLDL